MKEYKIHPVARLFPTLPAKEHRDLRNDIEQRGIITPILVNKAQDTILDGRSRYLAAKEIAKFRTDKRGDIPVEIFDGEDSEIPAEVISRNIRRRHLTKIEQVELISAVLKAATGDAGVSRHDGEKLAEGRPKDAHKAAVVAEAKKHAISRRTVERGLGPPKSRRPSKPKPERSLVQQVQVKWERLINSFPPTKWREVRKIMHDLTAPAEPYDPNRPKLQPTKSIPVLVHKHTGSK